MSPSPRNASESRKGAAAIEELRARISSAFTRVEDFVYVALGVLLGASAVALLFGAVAIFIDGLQKATLGQQIVGLLDRILLILMIVEILYTVQVSFREHTLVPEPFLIVGLIAAIRRILVLTAEFSRPEEIVGEAFRNAMVELGLLTLMILAVVFSLHLLGRRSSVARNEAARE